MVALGNDALDYGLRLLGLGPGYHPPLRYEPGVGFAAATVLISVASVALAARAFERLDA